MRPWARSRGVEAGYVLVFSSIGSGAPELSRVANPAPTTNGNFGHWLATASVDADALDDLYVSAIGNAGSGVPSAGEVYRYQGPIGVGPITNVLDPAPNSSDLPSPRFGMHIVARDGLLAVGAPRKDLGDVTDTGRAFLYDGGLVDEFAHPRPLYGDLTGFRVMLADLVGDGTLDVAAASLPAPNLAEPNRPTLFVWDGQRRGAPPRRFYPPQRAGARFASGVLAAQLVPGGHEELVLGDATHGMPGFGIDSKVGRVVILLPDG